MRTLEAGSFEFGNYLIAPRAGKWLVWDEDCQYCESFASAVDAVKFVIALAMQAEDAARKKRYTRRRRGA
jgi:hypothetical protein